MRAIHTALDVLGIVFDAADGLNAFIYALEGDNVTAALSMLFLLPCVGSLIGLPFKYAFKWGGNAGEALIKLGKKYAPELVENGGKLVRNAGGKLDDAWKWIQRKLGRAGVESDLDTLIKNGKISIDDLKANPVVEPDMLDIFNENIISIEHVF